MARFSGTGSYASSTGLPGSTYTVLLWYNLAVDTNSWQEFWRTTGSSSHFVETQFNGTSFTFSGGSGEVGAFASSLNTWYCAAVVVSGTSATVYHGTSPTALSTASGSCNSMSGASEVVLGNAVNGRINNLVTYSAALTAAEVAAELSRYQPARVANLLHWHPLINNITDYSGNGNDFTSGSGATIEDGPPLRWGRSRGPRVTLSTAPAQTISAAGIASAEAFGSGAVTAGPVAVTSTGIASAEAFGSGSVALTVTSTGIPSAEAFGAGQVEVVGVISSLGIPSAEAFGASVVQLVNLESPGIASAEVFGAGAVLAGPVSVTSAGIGSGEAFGAHRISISIFGTGIASAEAIPGGLLAPGPVSIFSTGIVSGEAFGLPELTITLDTTVRVLRPSGRAVPLYEVLLVARVPQATAPPLLLDVDPVEWRTLRWGSTLSKAQTLSLVCPIPTITDLVQQRLLAPQQLPSELWVTRNGVRVFAGPLLAAERTGVDEVTLEARGLLAYTHWMWVLNSQRFDQVDQFSIATWLIDQWQSTEHGHFGIDTSAVGLSGKLRDITYARTEGHQVSRRIEDLGGRLGGFDAEIDPTTRQLQLWTPQRGSDRSTGEDAIVFSGQDVRGGGASFSLSPGDFGSDAFGAGSSSAGGEALWSEKSKADLRATFGRTGSFASWSDVSEQTTLDDHVAALGDSRDQPLRVPARRVRVSPDADLAAYDVGDTVSYELDPLLGVGGAFRLRARTVDVEESGEEFASLEFV